LLRYELYPLIYLGQRQLDAEFGQGQNGVQATIDFADEAILRAPEGGHGGRVLLDEDVDGQRRDGQVGIFFLALVNAARGARKYLEDRGRLVLEGVGGRVGPADHGSVRVVEPHVGGQADANLGVRVVGPAAQAVVQGTEHIRG